MKIACRVLGHQPSKSEDPVAVEWGDWCCRFCGQHIEDLYGLPDGDGNTFPDIFWRLIHHAKRAICQNFGHRQMVDVSYGNEETGNMDHECRFCGEYFSVPLY